MISRKFAYADDLALLLLWKLEGLGGDLKPRHVHTVVQK